MNNPEIKIMGNTLRCAAAIEFAPIIDSWTAFPCEKMFRGEYGEALFEKGYCEISVDRMVAFAHSKGLEVLLETHTEGEFQVAIGTKADLIGINNRNLTNLKIDLNTMKGILYKNKTQGKPVVSESGIKTRADLQFLRACGANAFLIGSSIMLTDNIEQKVREFVEA